MSLFPNQPLGQWDSQQKLRDWGDSEGLSLSDAQTGILAFGATGSGKSLAILRHVLFSYLANGFGGLLLCSKPDDREVYEKWIREIGRIDDLIVFDASGKWTFNPLDWEAGLATEGGGFALNIVARLDELADAIVNQGGKGNGEGTDKFWAGALRLLIFYLVELVLLARLQVSLPLLRSVLTSAPISLEQASDPVWRQESSCVAMIQEADKATMDGDEEARTAFEDCRDYFLKDYAALSDKTRSIISMSFLLLIQPFLSRPLRKLFCGGTNVNPEMTFNGKIILVDLPIQTYRIPGKAAQIIWKLCFQAAVLRRKPATDGKTFLRPVFLIADEAQEIITKGDAAYQCVARSAGGCTFYLTQNYENFLRVLGDRAAVDSFLNCLSTKFFCQNTGETNEWAAKLLGEHWIYTNSTNVGSGRSDNNTLLGQHNHSSGVTRSEQRRFLVEPSTFTTLKRGGAQNDFKVEAIVYKGGHLFKCDGDSRGLPYKYLTFDQR